MRHALPGIQEDINLSTSQNSQTNTKVISLPASIPVATAITIHPEPFKIPDYFRPARLSYS
jgi:hypothetical protein